MLTRHLTLTTAIALVASLAVVPMAHALNPQPEVPSKQNQAAPGKPKALNPQPEVPSKPGVHDVRDPKELNPQPEVPSKPKKGKKQKESTPKNP